MRFSSVTGGCIVAGCVGLLACGSSSSNVEPDAPSGPPPIPDTAPPPPDVPEVKGDHHLYVVSSTRVPTSNAEVAQYSLDLGGPTSAEPDGRLDNSFGKFLLVLAVIDIDVQGWTRNTITRGGILELLDVQSANLGDSPEAAMIWQLGADPSPAACDGPADSTCGRHLAGNGTFTLVPGAPVQGLTAAIASGALTAGPGTTSLQLSLAATGATPLRLTNARVRTTELSNDRLVAYVGGAIPFADLQATVYPALHAHVITALDASCAPRGERDPALVCGCTTEATMGMVRSFDTDRNCDITIDEFTGADITASYVQPDVCSQATCEAADAVSFGVQIEAVRAFYPVD